MTAHQLAAICASRAPQRRDKKHYFLKMNEKGTSIRTTLLDAFPKTWHQERKASSRLNYSWATKMRFQLDVISLLETH